VLFSRKNFYFHAVNLVTVGDVKTLSVKTSKKEEFIDITGETRRLVDIENGVCIVSCPHTAAGLTINEGADPNVAADIIDALRRSVPESEHYLHGEGNSPAHIKASLMGSTLHILVEDGRLQLGTWQSIYFCEFDGPRERRVLVRCFRG
jgi:secondary thiamine-phosphate synthase enzyme